MRIVFILFLLVADAELRADPSTVARQTRAWRANHEREILAEFAELLSIPNLASDAPNIKRNADAIRGLCEKRGLTTKLLTVEGAPPVVVADLMTPNAKRTIAFYAHYDGQPVDPAQWKSEPWKPVMRDRAGNDVDWRSAKSVDPNGACRTRMAMTRRRSSPCSPRSTQCESSAPNRQQSRFFSRAKKRRARRISPNT